jgi:hypothetical protein
MSDFMGLIGLVASVVGIPLTYVFARQSRRRPELRVLRQSSMMLDIDDRLFAYGLVMNFNDRPIGSICRTRLGIWNHRGDTIHGSDVIPEDPLRIQVGKDDTLLQVRLLARSRPQTKFDAEIVIVDPTQARISFDFLDSADGGVFEIIHEGTDTPMIAGTVRGVSLKVLEGGDLSPSGLKKLAKQGRASLVRRKFPLGAFGLLALCAIAVFGLSILRRLFPAKESALVDPSRYDLMTPKGQSSFSEAVSA